MKGKNSLKGENMEMEKGYEGTFTILIIAAKNIT
jgi:hypothetical protein